MLSPLPPPPPPPPPGNTTAERDGSASSSPQQSSSLKRRAPLQARLSERGQVDLQDAASPSSGGGGSRNNSGSGQASGMAGQAQAQAQAYSLEASEENRPAGSLTSSLLNARLPQVLKLQILLLVCRGGNLFYLMVCNLLKISYQVCCVAYLMLKVFLNS